MRRREMRECVEEKENNNIYHTYNIIAEGELKADGEI